MKVSVIIVNYNVEYFLEICLHAVSRALQNVFSEIIVIDNHSTDGSLEMIEKKFPEVIIIRNKDNKGFSKANNQGVAIAKGEYILFLNPDTVLPEDFFLKTIEYMDSHPQAGCLGPKIWDGKGQFSPESKRSFPSLSVAIYKTLGIGKLFSKSPYFNKYYAVHVGEDETAPVDVLMGCCMFFRKKTLEEIGGYAFDEDFFMYGEDIDLSYRIQKAGFQNIYFPETNIIHYKGESTKKASVSYVRIFNEALSLFVKKNYPSAKAKLFSTFINIGIVLRAAFTLLKNVLSYIKMPLLDGIILLAVFWCIKEVYLFDIKGYVAIKREALLFTVPVFIIIWLGSMYLNGVYETSYNPVRVIRGMAIGTILALAYYALLPPEYRYSRSITLFTAFIGTPIMLLAHQLLYKWKILKFIPYSKLSRKTVVVATEPAYQKIALYMQQVSYPLELLGRVAIGDTASKAIAHVSDLPSALYQADIHEVVFCADDLNYKTILETMHHCGEDYEYKIHLTGSKSFVGSNSRHTAGDIYVAAPVYNLSHSYHRRNKRIFDVGFSIFMIGFFPVILFMVQKPFQLFNNCIHVLSGKKTWVGYSSSFQNTHLPGIKLGVLPSYHIISGKTPSDASMQILDTKYAMNYNVLKDVQHVLKNFRFLGLN